MYDKFADIDIMELTLGTNAKIISQPMHYHSGSNSRKPLINGSFKSAKSPYLLQKIFILFLFIVLF